MPRDSRPSSPLLCNVKRTHGFEPLTLEGRIPNDLRGTFFKTGPGVFERFGERVTHVFEADGLMSAVRFSEGGAQGAVKIVESAGYKEEEAASTYLYNSNATWLTRMRAMRKGQAKTSGNTNMFAWQERLFALMEGGALQEIDAQTLETLESTDLGIVKSAFSAHPHRVAALKTTFNFGVRYGKKMMLDLFALPDHQSARCIGTLEAPWRSMVHDFMATEKHLIFLIGPVELVLWRALMGLTDFTKLFQWQPKRNAQLWVVPLDDLAAPKVFELDPIWAWHFAGGYESEDGVVVDLSAYPNFDSIKSIGFEEDVGEAPRFTRVQTRGKSISVQRLFERPIDFPNRHPNTDGAFYRHVFGATLDGLVHFDLETGDEQHWRSPGGLQGSEPLVVPRGPDELDAYILALVFDEDRMQSGVSIFEASRLSEGPVAKAWFDQPLPLTFHGTFVSS